MRRVWWCNGGYEISYGDFKGRRLIRQGHWKKERRLIGKPHASSQMPRTVDISASADDAAAIQSSTVYCDPLAFIAKDRFTPLFHAYIELCNTYILHLTVFPSFGYQKNRYLFLKNPTEVAQIQLDLIFLRKSTRLLPLIKILHLSANFDKTLGNETSTVDLHLVQVLLRSDIRWKTFINGENQRGFLRKWL